MSFAKAVFFLKNRFFRKKSYNDYIECLNYVKLSANEKRKLSFEKRKKLVAAAYADCPFYKKLYDRAGFHPDMLKNESDWDKIPVLEKQMIRTNLNEILSSKAKTSNVGKSETGGSTGQPLIVYKSNNVHYEVLAWRGIGYYGVYPYMNEGIVHRRVPSSFKSRLINLMLWWPTKRAYLNATLISDNDLERFSRQLNSKKIRWIVGYCGALEHLADYIIRRNIQIKYLNLVWSTSSPLTEIVRKKFEKAFRCPIMDQYGCCEMGNIAMQRPGEDCLAINSDYVHVDILNPVDGFGDICITDINTFDFPLIKYRLGDKSRILKDFDNSPDGFPRMAFVKGRTSDTIYISESKFIDGSYLTTICDKYHEYISCYQIYQHADMSIDFNVVPLNFDDRNLEAINRITSDLKSLVGTDVELKTNIVEKIDDTKGKRKFIISEIALSKLK